MKQIFVDKHNIVIGCSIGDGHCENGINVNEIPNDIISGKYKYVDGEIISNPEYDVFFQLGNRYYDSDSGEFLESENINDITQEEINLDVVYRLSCLELGINL